MTLRIEGPTHTADDKRLIADAIKAIPGVKYVRADMEREKGVYDYDVETDGQNDIRRELNRVCGENGWNILMLQLSDLTLEDIFLRITMDEGIDGTDSKQKQKSAPKINLKISEKDGLSAVKEDEDTEAAGKAAEAEEKTAGSEAGNEESNGGEE